LSYELTVADRVWNRATTLPSGSHLCPGDLALKAILLAHGLIMNGGVLHALEVLAPEELEEARDGFCFYGLNEVAAFLTSSQLAAREEPEDLGELEHRLDEAYASLIPCDSTIFAAFERHFGSNHTQYAPL
jgi:hypothetical protein